jgi:phenylpyruvate tautomerase PptA (4-oxalocrotonate tautomerase family)
VLTILDRILTSGLLHPEPPDAGRKVVPTYICTAAERRLSQSQKSDIAKAITEIHSEVTGAPAYFAQVLFQEMKPGNHFMGGVLLAHDHETVFVHGNIRAGRTPEQKRAMLEQMTAALAKAADIPATSVWIYLAELPPQHMVEFGKVLPQPGEEKAWLAALPAGERAFMEGIGRH